MLKQLAKKNFLFKHNLLAFIVLFRFNLHQQGLLITVTYFGLFYKLTG